MSNYIQRLKSYNSYSGCDMVATLQVNSYAGLKNNIYTLGSLQTISISTHQDKRPVRSLGNINAKEYTMGQRTIAGSLVFAVFDRHFADAMFKDSLDAINKTESKKISTIILPDELPPFDITISYANEYGHTSRMALYGVRLVNEGQVMSINDIYTENTYQFVATALEPLNKDENVGQAYKNQVGGQISSNARTLPGLTEEITTIIDSFNNGGDILKAEMIYLSVDVENPNTASGKGLAKFTLEPPQKTGEIKVYGANNATYSILIDNYPDSKTYSIPLAPGSYYATYEATNKTSNTVTFKIIYEATSNDFLNSGPVIDYVTDHDICILSNNINHDSVACYINEQDNNTGKLRNSLVATMTLKSRKAIFSSLIPNTVYTFKTFNSNSDSIPESLATQSKTLRYATELIDEFKNYITLNEDVITNDLDEIIEMINDHTTSTKNIYNLLDFALSIKIKPTDDHYDSKVQMKNEIIFCAVKFQNYLNYELNKYLSVEQPTRSLDNVYYNTINIPSTVEYCNIFKTDRGKSIFKEKASKTDSYEFIDKPNLRYYAYGVSNQTRGPKYDFVCFDAAAKNALSNYSTGQLNTMSHDVIHSMYSGISSENATRMAAEHFKTSNITYLSKPMVTVNGDLGLDVYLNYADKINQNEKLVICFAEANEALDSTLRKKVKFNFIPKLHISSFYSGIKFNSSYAVWIENTQGFIISKIETFNTHIDNQEILIEDENIKTKQMEKEINSIKNRLSSKMTINTDLNEILESEKYNYDSHESLIYDNIISSVIYNKAAFNNVFTIISKLLEVKSDKDVFLSNNFAIKAKYNRKANSIEFTCDKHINISYTYIDESTGEINKSIISPQNNTVAIQNNSGYTILLCIADGLYTNSGFIMIDNRNKNYHYYNLTTEVI